MSGYDITFTCSCCGHMLPQSYEEEDGLCFLCTPMGDEERQILDEALEAWDD